MRKTYNLQIIAGDSYYTDSVVADSFEQVGHAYYFFLKNELISTYPACLTIIKSIDNE